jgi:hypothetical protein
VFINIKLTNSHINLIFIFFFFLKPYALIALNPEVALEVADVAQDDDDEDAVRPGLVACRRLYHATAAHIASSTTTTKTWLLQPTC